MAARTSHRLPALAAAALAVAACASLGRAVEQPRVRLLGVEARHLSLTAADLLFDFQVENPNRLALVLDRVDYHLRINGQRLLDGRHEERFEIAAHGEGRIRLPVTVGLLDLARVIESVRGRDSSLYDLAAEFRFAVPVLGELTVPVHQAGEVPHGWLSLFTG